MNRKVVKNKGIFRASLVSSSRPEMPHRRLQTRRRNILYHRDIVNNDYFFVSFKHEVAEHNYQEISTCTRGVSY